MKNWVSHSRTQQDKNLSRNDLVLIFEGQLLVAALLPLPTSC